MRKDMKTFNVQVELVDYDEVEVIAEDKESASDIVEDQFFGKSSYSL